MSSQIQSYRLSRIVNSKSSCWFSHVSEGKPIKFAKKVTKHIRISRGWSFVSASIQPIEMSNLPLFGTPQTERSLTAWAVE
jgi:hypothetical protein